MSAPMPKAKGTEIIVAFGDHYDSGMQGDILLRLERLLRQDGIPAKVFKTTMADDSKLRSMMTPEERAKL